MPDGRAPEPGGWNRFAIEVPDLAAAVSELRDNGVRLRNEIVAGAGGKQILAEDPSGNPIELFEPVLPEAWLTSGSTSSSRCAIRPASITLSSPGILA